MPDDIAIKVEHVSKTFKLPHEKQSSIKGALISKLKGGKRSYERQEVLKDISFEIKKGEFFGIVGRNGSGKSTLLKMLAGIYAPTSGSIQVNGKLTPFIELGVGFNPELTGRENVFLNGALLGFNRSEMLAMYDDIVEFAEIERFMDQKLKNYSSGMQVRLAFSIAIRAKGDILLIDEVLAVGDAAFQQKCFDVFDRLKQEKRTIIFVSHDMSAVRRFCTRALYLDLGVVTHIGAILDISNEYDTANEEEYQSYLESKAQDKSEKTSKLKIKLLNENGQNCATFKHNEFLNVSIDWEQRPGVKNVGVAIYKTNGEYVFGVNTFIDNVDYSTNDTASFRCRLNLGGGSYRIIAAVFGDKEQKPLDFEAYGPEFLVKKQQITPTRKYVWEGLTFLEHRWLK